MTSIIALLSLLLGTTFIDPEGDGVIPSESKSESVAEVFNTSGAPDPVNEPKEQCARLCRVALLFTHLFSFLQVQGHRYGIRTGEGNLGS